MRRLFSSRQIGRQVSAGCRQLQKHAEFSTAPPLRKAAEQPPTQAFPLGGYYESIMRQTIPSPKKETESPPPPKAPDTPPETESIPEKPKARRGRKPKTDSESTTTKDAKQVAASPPPSTATSPPIPTPPPSSAEEKARIIFGSSLAGPAERAERLAELRSRSTLIAGVLVPPKPEEPDNCCMSGCVNCVWDRFRDEMEDWATLSAKAERKLKSLEGAATSAEPAKGTRIPEFATSMDDDGGGSESNWNIVDSNKGKLAKDFWDEELYKNVPVGIREFMKHEKKLKLKHEREGTTGG